MLLDQATLKGIRSGEVTLAFRRWKRPTVRAGGSLLTAAGRLSIGNVTPVDIAGVTPADARRAGFESVDALEEALRYRDDQLYRIEFGPLEPDPRVALRDEVPDPGEMGTIAASLAGMDKRAPRPWTLATLRIIADHPGVRAGELAGFLGEERLPFKASVRKLKALGLTRSLEVGYELSPRGRSVLDHVDSRLAGASE